MEDSVDTYLGQLESEELERMADRLDDLTREAGWPDLLHLVEVHRNKVVSQLLARPAEHVVYERALGVVNGMESFLKLIDKVQETRRKVRRAVAAGEG